MIIHEKNTNANYAFGNSFQVVYDDMKTMRFYGEIKADLAKGVTVEVDGTFNSYSNKIQERSMEFTRNSIEFEL